MWVNIPAPIDLMDLQWFAWTHPCHSIRGFRPAASAGQKASTKGNPLLPLGKSWKVKGIAGPLEIRATLRPSYPRGDDGASYFFEEGHLSLITYNLYFMLGGGLTYLLNICPILWGTGPIWWLWYIPWHPNTSWEGVLGKFLGSKYRTSEGVNGCRSGIIQTKRWNTSKFHI